MEHKEEKKSEKVGEGEREERGGEGRGGEGREQREEIGHIHIYRLQAP